MSDMSSSYPFEQELKKLLSNSSLGNNNGGGNSMMENNSMGGGSSSAGLGGGGGGGNNSGGMDMLEQLAYEIKLKQQQAAAVQALRSGVQPKVMMGNAMRNNMEGMFGEQQQQQQQQQHQNNNGGLESHSLNSLSQLLNGNSGNSMMNGGNRAVGSAVGGGGNNNNNSMDAYLKLAAVAAELRSSANQNQNNNNNNGGNGGMDPMLHSLMSKFKNDEILEMLAQKQQRDQLREREQQQQQQQQHHHLIPGMGNGQPKGRQIVKQNNLWNTEPPSNGGGGGMMGGGGMGGMKTNVPPPNIGNRSGMSDIGHFVAPPAKNYRNGGDDSGMFSSDFGGEFSSGGVSKPPPPVNDIFSQAAASANGFPTIGTFSVDAPGGGGGNGGGFNKDRNNQHMKKEDAGMFGDMGTFGQPPNAGEPGVNAGTQETGIIEKLLHSYGFIQCCERQARLFFHFSQFCGKTCHLKIGDPVEFEMTYDRRTGKPIACSVKKIAPEVVLSEERVTGTVTTEIRSEATGNVGETTGRISYENRGECFFLPYTKDDIEGNVTLSAGDKVSFQVATNQRGNLGACHIRLENPVNPVKYRGVVCSMKESFGFIERADVVKEIFFHFSEADPMELRPGDDVEFIIQTRNGKEVACNLTRLPPGSIVFEDVGQQVFKGQVLKPLDKNNPLRQVNDPLPGRIKYRAADHSEVEVPFGDKDQKGDFTLRHGDWVKFLLATDRRDSLQRATAISLLDETFEVSGEKREQGMVAALKEGFGFLRCVDRPSRLFFQFAEVLDTSREICVGDEVEFTVVAEQGTNFSNRNFNIIRIKHLPKGTVEFETLVEGNVEGVITREAPMCVSPNKAQERTEGGVITYGPANAQKTIMYFLRDCEKVPKLNDLVRFNICEVKRSKELIAVGVKDIYAPPTPPMEEEDEEAEALLRRVKGSGTGGVTSVASGEILQGFIAVLKENFGFIETVDHDEEIFFHYSNYHGNSANLELGQEVEYTLSARQMGTAGSAGNCQPAENVKLLAKGTIAQPKVFDSVYSGKVHRPFRCINPDQEEYSGLVQLLNENKDVVTTHEFGITSLMNKRDLLQKGDDVSFKVDAKGRAAEIVSIRTKNRAAVDSIRGQFGFLDYEVEEGKKLFFHMSEVQGNGNNLHSGDTVEFSIVKNQRNGKSSACNVVKVMDGNGTVRPERLLARLKINSVDETGPRLIVVRPPKGPDGSRGFALQYRMPRIAGVVAE